MDNPAGVAGLTGRGLSIGDAPGQTTTAVANFRLGEAWRALQRELKRIGVDIDAALASNVFTTEDLADVICQAAMRVLGNPAGVTKESGAVDDYSESREYGNVSQDVYFTAAELRRLTPDTVYAAPTAGSFKYL